MRQARDLLQCLKISILLANRGGDAGGDGGCGGGGKEGEKIREMRRKKKTEKIFRVGVAWWASRLLRRVWLTCDLYH